MTALFLLTAALTLAQTATPTDAPKLPERVSLRQGAGSVYVFGYILEAATNDRVLTLQIDAPWKPQRDIKSYPQNDVIRHVTETSKEHKTRVMKGFEESGMKLIGSDARYWDPSQWALADDVKWATDARNLVLKAQTQPAAAAEPAASAPDQAASAPQAGKPAAPGRFAYRLPQAILAAVALGLVTVIAKIFLF